MKRYKSKEDLAVTECDENCAATEKEFVIKKGTIWKESDTSFGISEVHLENDVFGWFEITKENLKKYFEELGEVKELEEIKLKKEKKMNIFKRIILIVMIGRAYLWAEESSRGQGRFDSLVWNGYEYLLKEYKNRSK